MKKTDIIFICVFVALCVLMGTIVAENVTTARLTWRQETTVKSAALPTQMQATKNIAEIEKDLAAKGIKPHAAMHWKELD